MLKKLLATIKQNRLIVPGDAVLVALSGGADSVALFHGLLRLRDRLSFSVCAAHLNHKLRGPDSDQDERFVRDLAKMHAVELLVESRDVNKIRRTRGGSTEKVARDVRYAFLRRAARKLRAPKIALGHNMDDNAETLLMNLIRGSGLKGLSAIPLSRKEGDFVIVRPLLAVTRSEILSFLKRENLSHREDLSNLDTSLTRNKVRHELLPLLAKEYNPKIERVLAETGRNLRDAEETLSAAIAELEKECVRRTPRKLSVNINRLELHPPALWPELFRRVLQERLGVSVQRRSLQQICQLVAGTRTESLGLPKALVACRQYDQLLLAPQSALLPPPFQKELSVPCEIFVPELRVQISATFAEKPQLTPHHKQQPLREIWRKITQGEKQSLEVFFDASTIKENKISVRTRREGDLFRPAGMKGSKKIKELFIDEKVPATLRHKIPIFSCGSEIIWIAGYRPAARFSVKQSTRKILRLALKVLYCDK